MYSPAERRNYAWNKWLKIKRQLWYPSAKHDSDHQRAGQRLQRGRASHGQGRWKTSWRSVSLELSWERRKLDGQWGGAEFKECEEGWPSRGRGETLWYVVGGPSWSKWWRSEVVCDLSKFSSSLACRGLPDTPLYALSLWLAGTWCMACFKCSENGSFYGFPSSWSMVAFDKCYLSC